MEFKCQKNKIYSDIIKMSFAEKITWNLNVKKTQFFCYHKNVSEKSL